MIQKEVEIFYGDIGTVRNELAKEMKKVREVISITQSVTASMAHTNPMLTVVLVYIPFEECPEEYKYNPFPEKENYIS